MLQFAINFDVWQLTKDEESDYEEDTLLKYDENDEYDQQFEQMKEANLKSKRVQIDEEIEAAKHELEEARSGGGGAI